jgi:hypothetical protein
MWRSLPLGVRIARDSDWDKSSGILLDSALPGFGHYQGFSSVEAAILGLSACLVALGALVLAFE